MLREPVILVEPHKSSNSGLSPVHVVVYESARKAILKSFTGQSVPACAAYQQERFEVPVHEVAAWRLAYGLGERWEQMVPTCVLRTLDVGAGALVNWREGWPDLDAFAEARAQVHAAAFWDALIGQQDRHARNFRFDARARRLALIDNGFAFARPGDRFNASVFHAYRQRRNDGRLTSTEKSALEHLLESDALYGLGDYLADERADALERRARNMLDRGMLPLPSAF